MEDQTQPDEENFWAALDLEHYVIEPHVVTPEIRRHVERMWKDGTIHIELGEDLTPVKDAFEGVTEVMLANVEREHGPLAHRDRQREVFAAAALHIFAELFEPTVRTAIESAFSMAITKAPVHYLAKRHEDEAELRRARPTKTEIEDRIGTPLRQYFQNIPTRPRGPQHETKRAFGRRLHKAIEAVRAQPINGEVTQQAVAERLGIDPRSLREHLTYHQMNWEDEVARSRG